MGLFFKKSGIYVIVCYVDGRRKYLEGISFREKMAYFTEEPGDTAHIGSYEEAERIVDLLQTVRGVTRIKIYDCEDDRWL